MSEIVYPHHAIPFIPHTESPQRSPWRVLLASSVQREKALAMVHLIAERLHSPESVLAVIEESKKQSTTFYWEGALLSNSFVSIALFYLYLARSFPQQEWMQLAQSYLQLAVQRTHQHPLERPGLFDGCSGFALALKQFCQGEPRYSKTLDSVNETVARLVLARTWKRHIHGVDAGDYDIMAGVSGILAHLVSLPSPDILIQEAILKLIGYLIWLSGENQSGSKNWFIPPEFFPLASYRQEYPDGYFNLGLSHGVPGPLAALSLAWLAGYRIPGQHEAIEEFSQWIVEHQIQDAWGINWPSAIPLAASYAPQQWSTLAPARSAWCYGAPGIVAALRLAADAREDVCLHQMSMEALEAVLRRPGEQRNIDSPTICHGIAGLLAICLRFAQREMPGQLLQEHIPLLVDQILAMYDPDLPLGVQNHEGDGRRIDDPGLLTGVVGIALVLLAAATPVEPTWDRALLIA